MLQRLQQEGVMTVTKIHAVAAVLAASLAGAPALAQPPGATVSEPLVVTAPTNVNVRTVRIAYGAADMTDAGRAGLKSRIRRAVGYVCGPVERELDKQQDRNSCRTAAFSSADSQIAEALENRQFAGEIVLAAR